MFGDSAQKPEKVRNTMMPTIRTGLRPHWSASFPQTGIDTVCVSR